MAVYDENILIENINRLMEQKNISQSKLAEICNSTQSTISKLLTKKQALSMDFVFHVSDYFGITIDLLCKKAEENDEKIDSAHFTSSKQISPYMICECLATIFKSCCQKTQHIKYTEDVYLEIKDEDDNKTGIYQLFCDQENDYTSIFFPGCLDKSYNASQYEDYDDEVIEYGKENMFNLTINEFLDKLTNLQESFDNDIIDYEAYVRAIEQNLAKIEQ